MKVKIVLIYHKRKNVYFDVEYTIQKKSAQNHNPNPTQELKHHKNPNPRKHMDLV